MPLTYRSQRYFPTAALTEPIALDAQGTTCVYKSQFYKRQMSTVVIYRPLTEHHLTYRSAQYTAHL